MRGKNRPATKKRTVEGFTKILFFINGKTNWLPLKPEIMPLM
jgi:hypothetical protein